MTLVTSASLHSFVRCENTTENSLLETFVTYAKANIENFIGKPISYTSRSFVDEGCVVSQGDSVTALVVPVYPIKSGSVSVTDNDGDTVDATDYEVRNLSGIVVGKDGFTFDNGPYTISCIVGLEAHPEYSTRIEPIVNMAILDIGADLYQRRNPNASSENASDTAVSYWDHSIPPRTKQQLTQLQIIPIAR